LFFSVQLTIASTKPTGAMTDGGFCMPVNRLRAVAAATHCAAGLRSPFLLGASDADLPTAVKPDGKGAAA